MLVIETSLYYDARSEKHQIIFLVVWSYGCTTNNSPGTNRKVWRTRFILRSCPEHCGFCVSSRCKFDHIDSARRSYLSVHAFTKPITQRFTVQLPTAHVDTKGMCCYYGMLHDTVFLLLTCANC
jgi:hypothetical protein